MINHSGIFGRPNIKIETINAPKYSSLPYPKGLLSSGFFLLLFIPSNNSISFAVSASECMPSEIIAELPVMPAAINLVIAMAGLAARAM